eukprot:5016633-Prymnesium_polylepis.1
MRADGANWTRTYGHPPNGWAATTSAHGAEVTLPAVCTWILVPGRTSSSFFHQQSFRAHCRTRGKQSRKKRCAWYGTASGHSMSGTADVCSQVMTSRVVDNMKFPVWFS